MNKFYTADKIEGPFDVIVIGSGASGLTCGAMLSSAGKRVLVLEQHFQPGGFTHTFTRGNFEWDVGIHYFGKSPHTSTWFHQISGLTNGRFQLEPFGEYLDELHFPDFHILVPNGYDNYEKSLIERFPEEEEGIKKYFSAIRYARKKLQIYFTMNLLPQPLTKLARRTIVRKVHRLATSTTDQVMSLYLKDEKLKSVLDAQWGNIGAPRGCCSFLAHAAMVGNYHETGGEYPIGGGAVFARELGRVIHETGSAIRVKAKVAELIIKDDSVQGVTLESGEEVSAPIVISSCGVFNTYYKFLKNQESCAEVLTEVKKLRPAFEYINLFIGFKDSPEKFGLGNGHTWIHPCWCNPADDPTWDVTDLEANPYPKVLFFSSSSLRDPDIVNRKHNGPNGQIVSAVKYGSFDKWKDSRWKHRDPEYHELKDRISDILMTTLDEKYPGIKANIERMELGTTLTYNHFTASYRGIPYGLAPVTSRYESTLIRPTTPIKNLLLCGQDLIMPGVPAAVGSANLCAALVLRKNIGAYWAKKGKELNAGPSSQKP